MSLLSRISFPLAVVATTVAGVLGLGGTRVEEYADIPVFSELADTVVYEKDAYKLRRVGDFDAVSLADSLLDSGAEEDSTKAFVDTIPHLTARDTIKVPDSLRLTDPFRYKYYVALIDSLTHCIVRDSLKASYDSLHGSYLSLLEEGDSIPAFADSIHARLDSIDWRRVDSTYLADSAAIAKAEHLRWYNSLSRKERKKYDMEQMLPIKLHEMDSLKKAKDKEQQRKDSIIENTPRILETYALPDSMQYKRIITWTVDQDFHQMDPKEPDTTYNYHFYDYPFQRKDVNATWLGVAGSPVQYYNFFNRKSEERVEFYEAQESWSYTPSTIPHYNSKTPHTELAYFGTLFSTDKMESDNLHLMTTQNITPEFNFTLEYDRFGGGGMLENEDTKNKNSFVNLNYLGRKYMAHAGFIHNKVERGENGGIQDNFWIRDTTVGSREIAVNLKDASSKIVKNTFYLDQQYRIPFDFIERWKARKDTSYVEEEELPEPEIQDEEEPEEDEYEEEEEAPAAAVEMIDRDVTSAYIGHSTEFSSYYRLYNDNISTSDRHAREFYNNVFNFDPTKSADSLGVKKLDNKVFLRLQPWSADAIVSKLDVGVGDYLKNYFDSTSVRPTKHKENSFYVYAGIEGQYRNYLKWNGRGQYVLLGSDFGNMEVEANATVSVYPFRRARKSPISLSGHFETSLLEPTYYQQHINTNHFSWDNDFSKISTTKIEGRLDIPRWKLEASVGYALLANNVYYDTLGVIRQNTKPMSVLSASIRKDFVIGGFLHLDNRALFQFSSNPEVIPLPTAALNLKYYAQFVVQRDETKTHNVMEMQIGVNGWYNTLWNAPAWNPALGVFHNQNQRLYENGPYFDIFINVQWKRACIFIKYQNFGNGWPMEHTDYFCADHYIVSESGSQGLKVGIFWPFYVQPDGHNHSHSTN